MHWRRCYRRARPPEPYSGSDTLLRRWRVKSETYQIQRSELRSQRSVGTPFLSRLDGGFSLEIQPPKAFGGDAVTGWRPTLNAQLKERQKSDAARTKGVGARSSDQRPASMKRRGKAEIRQGESLSSYRLIVPRSGRLCPVSGSISDCGQLGDRHIYFCSR